MLVWVLLGGHSSHNAQRWLNIGAITFQPSELAKLLLILFLASFIMKYKDKISSFHLLLVCSALFLVPFFLIFKQALSRKVQKTADETLFLNFNSADNSKFFSNFKINRLTPALRTSYAMCKFFDNTTPSRAETIFVTVDLSSPSSAAISIRLMPFFCQISRKIRETFISDCELILFMVS